MKFQMPNFYVPPLYLPLYWGNEQSGTLIIAVRNYWTDNCTQGEIDAIIAYLQYYIEAPCWQEGDNKELQQAREKAKKLRFKQDIEEFLIALLDMGLDPL